jgi:hypothetical protein
VAVLLAALALPAAPAHAAQPCVGVVVDARLLGGTVSTGCAKGDPKTGLAALTRAGFGYRFVPRQPGLVCQLGGQPDCARTTTTTYWSYWHRPEGSTRWFYSSTGAATYDPPPGSTEAWVWQDGGRVEPPDIALRSICPAAFAAPATARTSPAAASTTRRTSQRPSAAATTAPRSRSSELTGTATARTPTATAPPSTSTSPADAAATPETATGRPDERGTLPTSPAAGSAATGAGRGASLVGPALGVGLIAAVAGAAARRARRRPEWADTDVSRDRGGRP